MELHGELRLHISKEEQRTKSVIRHSSHPEPHVFLPGRGEGHKAWEAVVQGTRRGLSSLCMIAAVTGGLE